MKSGIQTTTTKRPPHHYFGVSSNVTNFKFIVSAMDARTIHVIKMIVLTIKKNKK